MHIPSPPGDGEKRLFVHQRQWVLSVFSLLGFAGLVVSSFLYFTSSPYLCAFLPFLAFTCTYYVTSFLVQGLGGRFDYQDHLRVTASWSPDAYPSVGVMLPTCGEDKARAS